MAREDAYASGTAENGVELGQIALQPLPLTGGEIEVSALPTSR